MNKIRENEIVDRTPCDECVHFDVCSYKLSHETNVKDISGYVNTIESLDIIYVMCSKFSRKSNTFIPREF